MQRRRASAFVSYYQLLLRSANARLTVDGEPRRRQVVDETGRQVVGYALFVFEVGEDAFVLEVLSKTRDELLSRRLLCADCYAGVWTYRSDR